MEGTPRWTSDGDERASEKSPRRLGIVSRSFEAANTCVRPCQLDRRGHPPTRFPPLPGVLQEDAIVRYLPSLRQCAVFEERLPQSESHQDPPWQGLDYRPDQVATFPPDSLGRDRQRQAVGPAIHETVHANYARAPYFDSFARDFQPVFLLSRWQKLVDLNIRLLNLVKEALGLEVKIIRTSSLPECQSTDATGKLIEMTRAVGGSKYLSGPGGIAYLDRSEFSDVALEFVAPPKSSYRQEWGGFVPDFSVVDALFNCGGETRNLLLT